MAVAAPRCPPAQGGRLASPQAAAAGLPPELRWQTALGAGRPAGCTWGCLDSGLLGYLLRAVEVSYKEEETPSQDCRGPAESRLWV